MYSPRNGIREGKTVLITPHPFKEEKYTKL